MAHIYFLQRFTGYLLVVTLLVFVLFFCIWSDEFKFDWTNLICAGAAICLKLKSNNSNSNSIGKQQQPLAASCGRQPSTVMMKLLDIDCISSLADCLPACLAATCNWPQERQLLLPVASCCCCCSCLESCRGQMMLQLFEQHLWHDWLPTSWRIVHSL